MPQPHSDSVKPSTPPRPPQPQFGLLPDELDDMNSKEDHSKHRFHKLLSDLAREYERTVWELGSELDLLRRSVTPSGALPPASNMSKQISPGVTSQPTPGVPSHINPKSNIPRQITSDSNFSKQTTPGRNAGETWTSMSPGAVSRPAHSSADHGAKGQDCHGAVRFHSEGLARGYESTRRPSTVSTLSRSKPNLSSRLSKHLVATFWDEEDVTKRDRVSCVVDLGLIDPEAPGIQRDMSQFKCNINDCMLSPIGKPRLCWDTLWCVSLVYDMWWSMFILVFSSDPDDRLSTFQAFSEFTMGFWFVDIILNFFTGFVVDSRHVVLDLKVTARRYAKTWLLFDIIATFPFDKILRSEFGSGGLSSVRLAKATKAIKLVKALRLIRAVKLLQIRNRNKYFTASFWLSRKGSAAAASFVLLPLFVLFSHFHGCLWASADPNWEPTIDSGLALRKYSESFSWAYTAITFGTEMRSEHASQAIVEALLCSERVILVGLVGSYVVFKTLAYFEQHAQLFIHQNDVMAYLKDHDVGAKSQIEVICTLHETAPAIKRQQHFHAVIDEFPLELRRKICAELWTTNLLTLELLEVVVTWNGDFVTEVAQIVKEEVHATKAILCQGGDPAISAYHVLQGKIEAKSARHDIEIPLFVSGNWIGERSLAFSGLTRDSTATCLTYTTVLMVPADGFQKLLEKLEIHDTFRSFVDNDMSSLCGRCGRICDHNTDECPSIEIL